MTQEDKELLLKDICARMPYGVIVNNEIQGDFKIYGICENFVFVRSEVCHIDFDVSKIKPYLFPLSSMTEEERITIGNEFAYGQPHKAMDILHKRHIDYSGLIPMGLAIDAPGKNIY